MTLNEAIERGISKLRLAHWANPQAHIEFDVIHADGKAWHGPWVRLYDSSSHAALRVPDPQEYLWHYLLGGDKEDWQEYVEGEKCES